MPPRVRQRHLRRRVESRGECQDQRRRSLWLNRRSQFVPPFVPFPCRSHVRNKLASQEQLFVKESQTRKIAETKARSMGKEVIKLQKFLQDKDEQLRSSTSSTEQSILESVTHGTKLVEVSNEDSMVHLTFNEDLDARPWWMPTSNINFLSEPFDESSTPASYRPKMTTVNSRSSRKSQEKTLSSSSLVKHAYVTAIEAMTGIKYLGERFAQA